ncbi:MAG: hypothetical protein U9P36_13420 [Thermodesulfobacteriota bacterium]|nr:hypothetical protein [Thermodesulfobacteriota bacterium]
MANKMFTRGKPIQPHLLCRCLSNHRRLSESSLTCLLRRSAHLQPPRLVKYPGQTVGTLPD